MRSVMMIKFAPAGIGLWPALALAGASALPPQTTDLRPVLARAGEYVRTYQRDFSLLVADERYVQEVTGSGVRPAFRSADQHRRTLVSEFALVRLEDPDRTLWLAFRDVVEVDGRPVRDREERLQHLFRTPSTSALAQAQAIARESARYNIGPLVRTVNVPTLALEFLERSRQAHSRFRKRGDAILHGMTTWIVGFEERARPTLIRTPDGRDVVTRGEAWIDTASGRILRTHIEPERSQGPKTFVTVTYGPDDRLGLWVPVEMQEGYETDTWKITAHATYDNYRRFETDVKLKGPRREVR